MKKPSFPWCSVYISICMFLVFGGAVNANAQLENIWVFGNNTGIDFSKNAPVLYPTSIISGERSASVCNEKGELLFYTSGDQVWTRDHQLMPHGDTLITDRILSAFFPGKQFYCRSTSNPALIAPIPGQPGKYYLFSLTETEMQQYAGRLYYSIIDMNLNNGKGDVDHNNKSILLDSNLTEHLSGAAGGRCNTWLICMPNANTQEGCRFKSFEITEQGISKAPVISHIPGIFSAGLQFGKIDVSPDGKRIAVCRSDGFKTIGYAVELYDFNAQTGLLSQSMLLSRQVTAGRECYYGVSFSPDGSKIYASGLQGGSSGSQMFQFDISRSTIDDIINSRTYIDNAFDVKRAPNGKIYYLGFAGATSIIGVLQQPNQPGLSCQPQAGIFQPAAGISFSGFPNVVPFIRSDTLQTRKLVATPCFAEGRYHKIQAANDSTGWNYHWNNGVTESSTTTDTPGIYWVCYYTPPCVYRTDTFHVQFANGVLPAIHIDTACFNAANGGALLSTYTGDTVQYRYTWMNGAGEVVGLGDTIKEAASGHYRLHIATANCDTTLTVYIPQIFPRVSFEADSFVCQDKAVLFRNTSDDHYTFFQWHFGNGSFSASRSPSSSFAHTGSYEVQLRGTGTVCQDTFILVVKVDSLLDAFFTADRTEICMGEPTRFEPAWDSSTTELDWFFEDGNSMRTVSGEEISHAYALAGNFPVKLTAHYRACPANDYVDTITVFPLPQVDLGADTSICLGQTPLLLQNTYAYPEQYIARWNTGDTTAQIWIRNSGDYTLTLSSGEGCTTTDAITVFKDCYLDIPNTFTPNGDGINDFFFPLSFLSGKVTHFQLQVFNRWGQIIYETSNKESGGWDGRFNGKDQVGGSYIYIISLSLSNGLTEQYQGNVTLLR